MLNLPAKLTNPKAHYISDHASEKSGLIIDLANVDISGKVGID